MVTPTTGSQSNTIPISQLTPRSVREAARRRTEERSKRRAEELASKLGSL